VFQAVADPTRRGLLRLLAERDEMSISSIAACFPSLSRTAVVKHLQVLADAGLVRSRRAGRETRYRLRPEPLTELRDWVGFFERYWDERLAILQKRAEAEDRDVESRNTESEPE
jgi:DNA-binding transcriptional ArsR family regulator